MYLFNFKREQTALKARFQISANACVWFGNVVITIRLLSNARLCPRQTNGKQTNEYNTATSCKPIDRSTIEIVASRRRNEKPSKPNGDEFRSTAIYVRVKTSTGFKYVRYIYIYIRAVHVRV